MVFLWKSREWMINFGSFFRGRHQSLSHSIPAHAGPAQHPAAAPRPPSSARCGRARVPTRAPRARARTSHGPRSATKRTRVDRGGPSAAAGYFTTPPTAAGGGRPYFTPPPLKKKTFFQAEKKVPIFFLPPTSHHQHRHDGLFFREGSRHKCGGFAALQPRFFTVGSYSIFRMHRPANRLIAR